MQPLKPPTKKSKDSKRPASQRQTSDMGHQAVFAPAHPSATSPTQSSAWDYGPDPNITQRHQGYYGNVPQQVTSTGHPHPSTVNYGYMVPSEHTPFQPSTSFDAYSSSGNQPMDQQFADLGYAPQSQQTQYDYWNATPAYSQVMQPTQEVPYALNVGERGNETMLLGSEASSGFRYQDVIAQEPYITEPIVDYVTSNRPIDDPMLPEQPFSRHIPSIQLQRHHSDTSTSTSPRLRAASRKRRAGTSSVLTHSSHDTRPPYIQRRQLQSRSKSTPPIRDLSPGVASDRLSRKSSTGSGSFALASLADTSIDDDTDYPGLPRATSVSEGLFNPTQIAKEKGSMSGGFVNFTPHDSEKILTGVAPSGSSKTKARREREAAEGRKRLSAAAAKAIIEAGGDISALEKEGFNVGQSE